VLVIVDSVVDLTADLKEVSELDAPFPAPAGRGDDAKRGGGPDSRDPKPLHITPRDMCTPDLHIDPIMLKARNFR